MSHTAEQKLLMQKFKVKPLRGAKDSTLETINQESLETERAIKRIESTPHELGEEQNLSEKLILELLSDRMQILRDRRRDMKNTDAESISESGPKLDLNGKEVVHVRAVSDPWHRSKVDKLVEQAFKEVGCKRGEDFIDRANELTEEAGLRIPGHLIRARKAQLASQQ